MTLHGTTKIPLPDVVSGCFRPEARVIHGDDYRGIEVTPLTRDSTMAAPWLKWITKDWAHGCQAVFMTKDCALEVQRIADSRYWKIMENPQGMFEFWLDRSGWHWIQGDFPSSAIRTDAVSKFVLKFFGVTMLEICFRCPVVLARVCFMGFIGRFHVSMQMLTHFDHFDVTRFQMSSDFYEERSPTDPWWGGDRKGVSECRHEWCLHAYT